jgi:predicted Ser/Thr protein kinase
MEKNLELSRDKMNDLLSNLITERYKMVCDKIKIEILNALIKLTDNRNATDGRPMPILTKYDLILIRDGIEELREKENKEQAEAMATVITALVNRGDSEVLVNKDD